MLVQAARMTLAVEGDWNACRERTSGRLEVR
jgi:hypothetical protein